MSKDIPLAISGAGGHNPCMSNAEPVLQPVDWKKEAEMMRRETANVLKDRKSARAFLRKVGVDLKTGRLIRP